MVSRIVRMRSVLALAVLAYAVPAWSADSPLAVVPASSPIVVQLHGLDRTKDRVVAALTAALPDMGPALGQQINAGLQNLPEGRKLNGLSKDGPIFVSFAKLPTPGGQLEDFGLAISAKVTDFAAFKDGLLSKEEKDSLKKEGEVETFQGGGKKVYIFKVRDFAVVTPDKDAAAAYQKNPSGLDSKLDQQLAAKFLGADVAAFVNIEAVNKEYGDQIKSFLEQIEQVFDSGAIPNMDKNSLEMAKKMFQAFGRFLEDGRGLVIAAEARPEGFHFGFHASVAASSKSAEFLKTFKMASVQELNKMPGGAMTYSAVAITPELFRALPTLFGVAAGGSDENKAAKAALNKFAEAGPQLQLAAAGIPIHGIQVGTYQDPKKAAEAQLDLLRALAAGEVVQGAPLKGKPEIKTDAVSHRGFKFHSAAFAFDLDKMVESIPIPAMQDAMRNYMKKLIGEEIHNWYGTDGKQYISLTGKDWDAARKVLDDYLDGKQTLAQDTGFQSMKQQFPPQSAFFMVMDAGRFLPVMAEMITAMFKEIPGAPPLPEIKATPAAKPAYVGFALTVQGPHLAAEMNVSTAAVQEARKIIEPIVKAARER